MSTGVSSGGGLTIEPAKFVAGKTYRLLVRGTMSTNASTSSTFNFRVKLGSTTIATTGNIFVGTNVTNRVFEADIMFTVRTTGASGTVMTMGMFQDENDGGQKFDNGTSTSTIDMTASKTIDVTVQMGSVASDIGVNLYTLTLEEIN